MKKVICDRCGKEEVDGTYPPRIIEVVVNVGDLGIFNSVEPSTQNKDLCLDCRKGLRDYLQPIPRPR